MINATYFQEHLPAQVQELGEASVEIHLHGGASLKVRRIAAAEQGYVLLEVYPMEGVNDVSKTERRKAGGTDDVSYDRLALPYESVSYVLLTVKEPDAPTVFGFNKG